MINEGKKMAEGNCVELLEGLEERKLKELLEGVSLITDPLGQELIKKAGSPNSPINVEELPEIKNGLRDEALYRLYQLEKLCIFKSSFAVINGRTTRIFSITDFGRRTIL